MCTMTALRRYHEVTKHTRWSVMAGGGMDWSIRPLPFKVYDDLQAVPAPAGLRSLLHHSNGVLRWREDGMGGRIGFHAAPCTGALYHVELYVAWAGGDGLPAGLYHYGAHDDALRRLRDVDVRAELVEATGGHEPVGAAPAVVILTSTFWRNAWKYRARAYRHAFWDTGAVLANLLALAAESSTPASLVMGFDDARVNRLIGVDGEREAAIALAAVGRGAGAPARLDDVSPISFATLPLSSREIADAEIEQAHRHSSLSSGEAAARWRARAAGSSAVAPPAAEGPIIDVIRRRRSTRRFATDPIPRSALDAVLAAATAPITGDALWPGLVEPFLIVNSVEGLEPGLYGPGLELIEPGAFRRRAGTLALGQGLAADAAVNVYLLSNLETVGERLGERGYRVAQIAGGIAGARIELAAIGLGLGGTGLTFFDDDAVRFLGPPAHGLDVMYLAAVGVRARR